MITTVTLVVMSLLAACIEAGDREKDRADPRIFEYEAAPFESVETPSREQVGVFAVSEIVFVSPSGGRVNGRLHRPATAGNGAGVILLHGSGGVAREMDAHGAVLACSGAVALAINAPNAGRGGSFVGFTEQDYEDQVRLIQDLRRSIDWLVEAHNVDSNLLGFLGVSYGAAMGSLLVGVEPRIDAAALMVGDGGLVAHFTEGGEPTVEVAGVPRIDEWLERMAPIEPSLFLADAAPMPLLLVSGRNDEFIPEADSIAWHEAAGEGSQAVWVETGHFLSPEVWADTYSWLGRHLGLDAQKISDCLSAS